ncbi:DUF2726 domain-containing protein [Helicobacter suis]|uniref:DUF2726 domain-containing protein n=1 Tax=Helicobacter suis TaxID=104628 RepID=UPI0024925A23|nr:DUF2726 domain-containing protein [Helicobacter suis]
MKSLRENLQSLRLKKAESRAFFAKQREQEKEEQERRLAEEAHKRTLEYKLGLIGKSDILVKEDLLGKHEFIIYNELIFSDYIKKRFIVFPQIPLKTLVYKKSDEDNSDDAWKTYNNLVVDFLFVLKDYKTCRTKPVAVLEYNGGGHYGTNPEQEQKVKENDQIKEIVVRKLGLKFYVLEGKSVCQENSYYIDKEVLRGRIQDLALKLENLAGNF